MRARTNRLAAVALVALVLLAGCSGAGLGQNGGGGDGASLSGDGDGGGDAPRAEEGAPEPTAAAANDAEATSDTTGQVQAGRAIIRTAEVRVEVDSYENASASLRSLVESRGGFVASSNREVERSGNETWTRGRLVLRVPSENFSDVYAGAQSVGRVDSATSDQQDVTDQMVDLNARIENLEVERERLRQLYENASDTEDVLAVERRLSEVQGEIERLEAKRQSLRDRVALSTVTVELHEPRPDPTPVPRTQFHEVGLVAAFLDSVNGVVVALQSLAVGVAYALPYVVVFGLPLAGLVVVLARYR
jgi:hypothetical protein